MKLYLRRLVHSSDSSHRILVRRRRGFSITAAQVAGIGANYVIIGHSERRAAGETDAEIAEKVKRALAEKLTPIVCIGENERDEDAKYLNVLREQLRAVLEPLAAKERLNIVIAYEPVWAIGRSALQAITPADLAEMVLYIRKLLSAYIPGKSSAQVRILYGGSVDPANVRDLAAHGGIEGFLIGRASVDVKTFSALVQAIL
jgi:triosephosphate isomerase